MTPTNYPASVDTTTQLPNDQTDDTLLDRAGVDHAQEHANLSDAVRAMQAEMGVNPSSSYATIAARLDDMALGSGIPASTLTTKGDIVGRSSSAVVRIPASTTNGQVLTVNTAASTGVNWATPVGATGSGVPSVEDYGVVTGTGVGSSQAGLNATAIEAALADIRVGLIPPGKVVEINRRVICPTRSTIYLEGDVSAVAGTWTAESGAVSAHAMFCWRAGLGDVEGNDGGMIGRGKLDCNGLARYGIDVWGWDNITLSDFKIRDPLDAHMHFRPNPSRPEYTGGATPDNVDCDACDISHITCGYTGAAFPARGMLFRDAGGNDSEIRNCKLNGFAAQTPGDVTTGGWGMEFRNSGRVKINSCYIGDNNRKITGGILWRQTSDDANYHEKPICVRDLYVEAGISVGTPDPNWIFNCLKVQVDSGITTAALREGIFEGLEFVFANIQTAANAKRLVLENNSSSGMIRSCSYLNPRDHLTAAGQITISSGAIENLIELRSATTGGSTPNEAQYVTNNGGSTNRVRNILDAYT